MCGIMAGKKNTDIELYTFDEVKEILKTNKQQLRILLNSGQIKGFKLGKYNWRIPVNALEDYINRKMS